MRQIPLDKVPTHFHRIKLQNGKEAVLYDCNMGLIEEVDPKNEVLIYRYMIPCPLCGTLNRGAYSYDGVFFANTQMVCSDCGIYYRPVILRSNS
jgi:hypothetical protein